jgi:hypothetical protein
MAKSSAIGDSSPQLSSATQPTSGSCTLQPLANIPSVSSDILEGLQQSCSHTFLYLSDTAPLGPFTHYSGSDGVVRPLANHKVR